MTEQRYREAETALWRDAGVTPAERRIHLTRNDVDVRITEIGAGPAVLFVHGGPGASGAIFAHLAARLPQFRCILIDRPGTGLSDPSPLSGAAAIVHESETLVVDVLDALELESAHLIGSSHGSFVTLLSAAANPDRVGRSVHLGCPGFIAGMKLRGADRLVLAPGVAWMFARLPASEGAMISTMKQLGHEESMASGAFPDSIIHWGVALMRETGTMRNELAAMARMGTLRAGFDPSLTIGAETLARVTSPTHVLWGTNDPYGDESVARAMVDAMPDAELTMLQGAGHLCWLDDVDRVADAVQGHLAVPLR